MRELRLRGLAVATALVPPLTLLGVGTAAADAPPPAWDATGDRTLTCGSETLVAQWSRGGPLTVLLVKGSNEVIVPKLVLVTRPGATAPQTTLAVPGFDRQDLFSCEYTDPAGLFVQLWGIRT